MIIKPSTPEAYKLIHDGILALSRVEETGIGVDVEYLQKTKKKLAKDIREDETTLRESEEYGKWRRRFGTKTNLSSRRQAATIFFDVMGYKPSSFTEKGTPQVDEHALQEIGTPFAKAFLRLEKLRKLHGTFLSGIDREVEGDRLHPFFNLHIPRTFRGSSDSPNFQNFPVRDPFMAKIIRSVFRARPGFRIVETDYVGVEVRGAACYHKDPVMLKYIKDPTKDMHRDMAQQCFLIDDPSQVSKEARYCNTGEAPIHMHNGPAKLIEEVRVGDSVLGWITRPDGRKQMVASRVIRKSRRKAEVVKITMASGKVIRCTADHRWYNRNCTPFRKKKGLVNEYIPAAVGRYLCYSFKPVEFLTASEREAAAYLAGIYDGEGSKNVIAQCKNHNPEVCAKIEEALRMLGIEWSYSSADIKYCLLGGLETHAKLAAWMSSAKPYFRNSVLAASSFLHKDKVVAIEADGTEWVYSMTTSTGNYFAWGYASKNCGKNMFVFPQFYGDFYMNNARSLWDAMVKMELKVGDKLMIDHLKSKGITERGDCDPGKMKGGTPAGDHTFEAHIQKVEHDFWNNRFKKYGKWKKNWLDQYVAEGGFSMLTGFRVEGVLAKNDVINYPVQGASFHCLLWSLIELERELRKRKMKSRIVGQIHDSLIAEVPDNELAEYSILIDEIMTKRVKDHWSWIITPLDIEMEVTPVGGTWYEKKKTPLEDLFKGFAP